jgi:hypothetical protein
MEIVGSEQPTPLQFGGWNSHDATAIGRQGGMPLLQKQLQSFPQLTPSGS